MTVHRRTLRKVRDLAVGDTTVILNSVQRHVMRRAVEPDPDRRNDVLHPSDMSKADWCIAAGSLVRTRRGDVPIEQVGSDDLVLTRSGFRPVQHVTYMGERECITLLLSNGTALTCTPEHQVATSGGWLSASLVQCLPAEAATALPIAADVGVHGIVEVSGWAGDSEVPSVVMPMESHRHEAQMAGAYAGSRSAAMINFVPGRNVALEDAPRHPVGGGVGVSDSTVAIGGEVASPEPTAIWCLVDAGEDVLAVEGDSAGSGRASVGTTTTPCCAAADGGPAIRAVHTVSVTGAGIHSTYDIGVIDMHEFTANGVVVHNCWRADYYRIKGVPTDPRTSSPSFFMETIFEEGHGIHRKWQGWLHEMGWLYGVFGCKECGERWWDTAPMSCPFCLSLRRPRYLEIPLEAPELWIAGLADGGIDKGDGQPLRLLEVKSISLGTLRFEAPHLFDMYNNNESLLKIWQEIKRPFPTHLRQGMTYLYLINRGVDALNVPEIVFIYEWKPTQAVKEFVVKFEPRYIERILAGAQMVTDGLEIGRPPKRPRWAEDEDSKYCKSCSYRKTCWKLGDDDDRQGEDAEAPRKIPVKRAKASVRRRALRAPLV